MKNIIVLSDGTGQTDDQDYLTNIGKLNQMLERSDEQIVFYDAGVGTNWQRLTGKVYGAGIEKNIQQCYRFISQDCDEGDKIYLFGYSRGAATVRMLSRWLELTGVPIEFIGCFDTVAALGCSEFKDYKLSPNVKRAYHALALDETRKRFKPALWDEDERVTQKWFVGSHRNIGGPDDGLSDCALNWMCQRAMDDDIQFTYYNNADADVNVRPNAPIHNPRKEWWRKLFWRKGVRQWPEDRKDKPVMHWSVLERKDYSHPMMEQ